jgi:tetratricopeptide (TPR) repeat protein
MATIGEALAEAIRHHQTGRLQAAERIYRQILAVDPNHADALNLLGVIAQQNGNYQESIHLMERALLLNPSNAAFHNNLGESYRLSRRISEALTCYQRALQLKSDYCDAWNNLGIVQVELGKVDDAIASFRHALALRPDNPQAHNNLGNVLRAEGKLQEALASYDEAIRLKPDYAVAHHNRGMVLRAQKRLDEAITAYQDAIRLNPAYAEAHADLGDTLLLQKKLDQAILAWRESLRHHPDNPDIHNRVGMMLFHQDRVDEAAAAYREAIRWQPDFADAHYNLGNALQAQGRSEQAIICYDRALRFNPSYAEAFNGRGAALQAGGHLEESVESLHEAIRLKPDYPEAFNNLGIALSRQGKVDEAVPRYREAIRLKPDYARAYGNLGSALVTQANVDEAIPCLRESIRLDPRNATSFYSLSELVAQKRYTFAPEEIAAIEALLAAPKLSVRDRAQLHFALAAHCERLQQYDEAFAHFRNANDLSREDFRLKGKLFRPEDHRRMVDVMLAFFTPAYFDGMRSLGSDSQRPIFVVGMPRSGTTLVEQILASHPRVFGAGELRDFQMIATGLSRSLNSRLVFPHCLQEMTGNQAQEIAGRYLEALQQMAGVEVDRVVDKMPTNFELLGLIATLFPRATIIHCKRDARDVCLSCYCQNFESLRFAASLEDLGHFWCEYERLMEHWRKVLPQPIHEVQYEELVRDPEPISRQLIAACGLDWDDRCLAFYEGKRVIQTASKLQVRQPIYSSSVARWKRYESHLEPLFLILNRTRQGGGISSLDI